SFWKAWLSMKMSGFLPVERLTATLLPGVKVGPMTVLPGKRIRWTRLVRRSHTPRAWLLSSMWLNTMKRPSSDHDGDMAMPGISVILRRLRPVGLVIHTSRLFLPLFFTKASVERKKSPRAVRAGVRAAQQQGARARHGP